VNEAKGTLETARASVAAVFDNRLEQITETANILLSVDASLQKVDEQLKAKPLDVKEQVQKELAEPLKLAERLAAARESAPDVVARVVSKWRRFWGQLPRQMLSREQQCGLFAEIWFLSIWLVPRFGITESVTRWRGPTGARHDFEWTGRSVEVKATTSTRGRIHRINGLDQLAPPDQGDLLLFSLRLREEAGANNTLPALVAASRMQFDAETDALSRFENVLAQSGYSPAHEDEYGKMRLRIVEQGLFAVRDNFPRLTAVQISGGVPPGLEHVDYEINLGGFMHLCIAREPHEATNL